MISLQHVSKKYGQVVALQQLDLNINREFFVFLGPNGADKTTTIKMMTGLLTPSSGSIHINNISLLENPLLAKQQFGLVPDEPSLYEKLKAREFFEFVAAIYKVDPLQANKRMNQLAEIFELTERLDDFIDEFSHGMKQKVALIAALLHDPAVLILDEPTVGLDPHSVRNLKDILKGLVKKGKTVFMSTHILEVAEQMCDRIGIIEKGKLLALGSLDELRQQTSVSSGSLEDVFLALTGNKYEARVGEYLESV